VAGLTSRLRVDLLPMTQFPNPQVPRSARNSQLLLLHSPSQIRRSRPHSKYPRYAHPNRGISTLRDSDG